MNATDIAPTTDLEATYSVTNSAPTTSRATSELNPTSSISSSNITSTTAAASATATSSVLCRYFARGVCRFGNLCRFSHDATLIHNSDALIPIPNGIYSSTMANAVTNPTTTASKGTKAVAPTNELVMPSTSKSWVNAPIFIPKHRQHADAGTVGNTDDSTDGTNRTWAEVAAGNSHNAHTNYHPNGNLLPLPAPGGLCPYEYDCPYGLACTYQHIQLCEMCDTFCLHPTDIEQRRNHIKECLQQHERDMELSFAIARSKDKACGICFDTIMEKSGREKRFGILPNCSHIFCLECIRRWRQAKQFEHKITRACPECRVASDFVCPSAFWVETKEEKEKLLVDYRKALGVKDCKYFKKGEGKCPFGNKCFYKHALPNGELVDVGCPPRARKIQRNSDELMDLLDIYLWEFVDQRDFDWLDLNSNTTDSDESDWYDA